MSAYLKRIGRGWIGLVLAVITLGAFVFGVTLQTTPIMWSAITMLVVTIGFVLWSGYQLSSDDRAKIEELEDEVWSLSKGTHLKIDCPSMPVLAYGSRDLILDDVYVVNRGQRSANVSFALVARGGRMKARGTVPLDGGMPSPAHVDAGANRSGQLSFDTGGFDLTPFVIDGVQLEVTDQQTGYSELIEIPTTGVVVRQRRTDSG